MAARALLRLCTLGAPPEAPRRCARPRAAARRPTRRDTGAVHASAAGNGQDDDGVRLAEGAPRGLALPRAARPTRARRDADPLVRAPCLFRLWTLCRRERARRARAESPLPLPAAAPGGRGAAGSAAVVRLAGGGARALPAVLHARVLCAGGGLDAIPLFTRRLCVPPVLQGAGARCAWEFALRRSAQLFGSQGEPFVLREGATDPSIMEVSAAALTLFVRAPVCSGAACRADILVRAHARRAGPGAAACGGGEPAPGAWLGAAPDAAARARPGL
jgi:hypothetical protein